MKELQQSVFLNLSRVSKYQERSRCLNEPRPHFAKEDEIRNEFELLDFNGSGKLSRERIKNHLVEKYQKVNFQLLDKLFATMSWDQQDRVEKNHFCEKYLKREKQLYHDISASSSLGRRLATNREIFEQTRTYRPHLYANIRIAKMLIKSERQGKECEQWMDIEIQYEDHKNKFNYLIEQQSYGTEEPSLQVLLPVQENYFFVKYRFYSPKGKERMYGQCYVNIPVANAGTIKKHQKVAVDITNINNEKRGYCEFNVEFQSNMNTVERRLVEEENNEPRVTEECDNLKKEYEYLQYLWGIRHKYPHKIANIDVKWMIIVRIVLLSLLGVISIIVQTLGRCEPLSFILALVLAKNWKYVMIGSEKFLLCWVDIAAICLDLIWIAFGAQRLSQINYLLLQSCSVLTYILLICKILLLLYLLIIEKAFSPSQEAA